MLHGLNNLLDTLQVIYGPPERADQQNLPDLRRGVQPISILGVSIRGDQAFLLPVADGGRFHVGQFGDLADCHLGFELFILDDVKFGILEQG